MKKRNEKGFFLVETMLVISVVAVVLLIVFKLFTSVYYGFLESENYNTVNAINALSNIQKYYESIGEIDTSLLSEENTYIELTNDEKYVSPYYTRIKEEYGVTDVYLIDLEYFLNSNSINNFPVLFRRYLKTLKNIEGIAIVICTNGSEFSYVKLDDSVNIILNGDEEDEYGVYINVGGTFTDPGYTGWDGKEPQTEWENGKVLDTNTPGTYYLHYNFDGYLFRRKVEVVNFENYNASFAYTGGEQEYIVNAPGYYKIELWGAQGGNSGGKGAYTTGKIFLSKNTKLFFYVGGSAGSNPSGVAQFVPGGYNGGGSNNGQNCCNRVFGSGGGATDVRLENGAWDYLDSLKSRIMVAAGGGGKFSDGTVSGIGGDGGTLIGLPGMGDYSDYCTGQGATQTNAGIIATTGAYCEDTVGNANYTSPGQIFGGFGYGGAHGSEGNNSTGGGGGYYGGGSSGHITSAGGGSSFISGYAGVNAITSSLIHTNNTLHYSNKYFINGKMQSGVNEGNGKAKITYLGPYYPKKNTKLNNTRYIKDCINGSNLNIYNHWVELQAIYAGFNVAEAKNIMGTGVIRNPSYPYSRITDGDITASNFVDVEEGLQCVTADLGNTYDLDEIAVWHYYGDARSYNNHSLYVSSDNETWTTLIDNVSGVTETSNGIRVSAYE